MKQICDHIGFLTASADMMKKFYTTVLGFDFSHESILDKSVVQDLFGFEDDCRFIKLKKNGFMIELFEPLSVRSQERVANTTGVNHWGYCAENGHTLVEKIREIGLSVVEISRNGRRVYFINDPDGNRIEIRDCQT